MDTEIKQALTAAEGACQYDEQAKRLLSHKSILAHILVHTVEEFQGMDPKEVEQYIEGEPHIGTIAAEPGLVNRIQKYSAQDNRMQDRQKQKNQNRKPEAMKRIVGLNTENSEIHEGVVRFDLVFYVRMKDGISQMIVNIEAQKDEPGGYDIRNRAVYYVSRLISSQKERDFSNSNYNDIKQVVSIWICMNMEDCIRNDICLTEHSLLGNHQWGKKRDLFHIVLLGLPSEPPEQEEKYELHRLLTVLLSVELTVDEKLTIMEEEYDIEAEKKISEEMREMCNLGQGVLEKGIAQGMKKGKEQGIQYMIINMHKTGISREQIAKAAQISQEEVQSIIDGAASQ